MNLKVILSVYFISTICVILNAQAAGNALYGNNSYENISTYNSVKEKLNNGFSFSENGNSINYQMKIMSHVVADYYLVTLGVNEERQTIEICNAQINQRIERLISQLKSNLKIKDVYVDFIAQVPIYDFYLEKTGENQYNGKQEQKGFEIKKNLIIKITDIQDLDEILSLASKEEIYNLINVEYYNNSMEDIYDEMIAEAKKIYSNKEKQRKMFDSDKEEFEDIQVNVEKFSVQPISMYREFKAFETSEVSLKSNYNQPVNYVQQELRKSKSFYFRPFPPDSFDLVMNEQTPTVGIQYVVIVTVNKIKKQKSDENKIYHIITPAGDLKELNLN